MSTHGDGGKGSSRRQEDVSKINENWDRIFGSKVRSKTMDEYTCSNDHDDEDDGYEICHRCSGSGEGMYDGSTCSHCKGTGEEPVERGCDDFDFPEDDYND
jgi:DnaJ-class molecular chaperone